MTERPVTEEDFDNLIEKGIDKYKTYTFAYPDVIRLSKKLYSELRKMRGISPNEKTRFFASPNFRDKKYNLYIVEAFQLSTDKDEFIYMGGQFIPLGSEKPISRNYIFTLYNKAK